MIFLNSCLTRYTNLPNYTKQWKGSDLPGHNYAAFEDFNGKQSFRISAKEQEILKLKYSINVTSGNLSMVIKSPRNQVLSKTFIGSTSDSVNIENQTNGPYKVEFIASHAAGNFDLSYSY